MIDFNQFESIISSNLYLPSETLNIFVKKIKKTFEELESDINKMNCFEALDALSMLTYFKSFFNSELKWQQLIYVLLEKVRNGIYNYHYHPYSFFTGISYVGNIVQELSKKIPSLESFLYSVNELLSENLNVYLSEQKVIYSTSHEYELIQGFSGPLRYLLEFLEFEQSRKDTTCLIDYFSKRSNEKLIMGYKVPGWHYYQTDYEKSLVDYHSINGLINYGVSHGMGGPLAVLSVAYNKKLCLNVVSKIMDNIVEEYLKASYYINNIIYWPGITSFEQYTKQDNNNLAASRMSWCYGSIGILRVLYTYSIAVSRKDIEKLAVNEMIKIAQMNTKDYMLTSPIVCHGYAGTAAIMKEMYNDTKNPIFHTKSLELLEYAIKICVFQEINPNSVNTPDIVDKYTYLSGFTGILQTIYSILTNIPNGNEKRLLIG